jgi:aspartyl/asparaginyl beta-hydroxylase (cupin superfamily)
VTIEDPRVVEFSQRAYNAMAANRMDEAVKLWSQIRVLAPDHPQALFHLGQIALRQGNHAAALELLDRAALAAPGDAIVHLNVAWARRQAGDGAGELKAYEAAIVADPRCYPAMLGKAALLERAGKQRQSSRLYKDALSLAPPAEQMPPELAAQFARARDAVQSNSDKLAAFLAPQLAGIKARHSGAKTARFDECVDVVLGRKKVFTVQPTMLHYPALAAIQFYDDAEFPWLPELEAQTEAIGAELVDLLQDEADKFRPYVAYAPGVPVDQWHELNHSQRWSSYFLWNQGERIDAHCRRCPKTAALMERLPLAQVPGFAPTVMFSVLLPHTRIPPHTGVTNTRLVCHLPLIVPDRCRFRVGNETRDVVKGKAWVFDDSIEHEAWNDSDETRIILIVDVWNPYLNAVERDLVCELLVRMREYYREDSTPERDAVR